MLVYLCECVCVRINADCKSKKTGKAKQSKTSERNCEFNRNLLSLIQIQFADTTEMHYPFMLRLQSIKSREMPV